MPRRLSVYPARIPATVRQSPPSASRPALDRTRRPFDRWPRRRPLPMIPATVRPCRKRPRLSAVRKSPPSNAGKPWRPCAAGFRPMSPDSSRRVRNRWPSALLSRQPFASRPPNFAGNAAQTPAIASARAGRVRARPAAPCACKAV